MPDETVVAAPGADTAAAGADTGLDFDIGESAAVETPTTETETPVTETEQHEPVTETKQIQDDPDVQDFRGHVSNRIRNLVKQAPELGSVLTKYPKVRDAIEAPLRREAAYRDVFPTVAEAKAMRERFPNGLQDVQALQDDIKEIEQIDDWTYTKDQDGNYSGHSKLIDNVFSSDRNAAVALFRTLPREWHRLDPDSYNDVMGKIVGATLIGSGSWEQLVEARETAAAAGDAGKGLVTMLDKVLGRLSPFVEERRPDPAQEALNRERQQFDKQRSTTQQQDQQQFDRTFGSENVKLQKEVIQGHRVIRKLATVKSVTPQKRAEIVDKVRTKMEQFLRNSPSFMRKITAAYQSRNMEEAAAVQRAAWGQEWLLNRMIRDVLKVETPQLINNNRATVQKRTGTAAVRTPVATATRDNKPTAPFKEGGVWYHANGHRMTTVEAMKHEMARN